MAETKGNFKELGTPGLESWGGWIRQAYNNSLYWPSVAPLYDRIWRSDPEVAVARLVLESMTSDLDVKFDLDPGIKNPTSDDYAAVDFGNEVLNDIHGGISKWLISAMTRVPFYGWGWWEVVPGVRSSEWNPPGQDPWRSHYDDGLIGYRRFSFRNYSSFERWEIDDATSRLEGMYQFDPPNSSILLPLNRSLHCTFGDHDNPEGLASLEALWRLERIKYGFEIIQGIGFEHAAGHVKFEATKKLSADDKTLIKKAARSVLTAQEGNYMSLPDHITAEVLDVSFESAASLLDAIRYYGILKLAVFGMQWAALGVLSPYGSYSSLKDANTFFLAIFNAMAEGFVDQADQQIGQRLFDYSANKDAFPNITRRPVMVVNKAEKMVDLAELGDFMTSFATLFPMDDDDVIAIRRKSDFLSESLPEVDTVKLPEEEDPEADNTIEDDDDLELPEDEDGDDQTAEENADMSFALSHLSQGEFSKSVAVMLPLPEDVAEKLHVTGDGALAKEDLHLTLMYLGEIDDLKKGRDDVLRAVMNMAMSISPFEVETTGSGVFDIKEAYASVAHVALIDGVDFPDVYNKVRRSLSINGIEFKKTHGFIPHVTLGYSDNDKYRLPIEDLRWEFDTIGLGWGNEWIAFPLIGESASEGQAEVANFESHGILAGGAHYVGAPIAPLFGNDNDDLEEEKPVRSEAMLESVKDIFDTNIGNTLNRSDILTIGDLIDQLNETKVRAPRMKVIRYLCTIRNIGALRAFQILQAMQERGFITGEISTKMEFAELEFATGKAVVEGGPLVIGESPYPDENDITRAMKKFRKWARKTDPDLAKILDAKVVDIDAEE